MSAAGNAMQPDLLGRLVERISGREPVVLPRPASAFETRAPRDGRLGEGHRLDETDGLDGFGERGPHASGVLDEQAPIPAERHARLGMPDDKMPPANRRDEADLHAPEHGALRASPRRDDVDEPAHAQIRAREMPGTHALDPDETPAIDALRRLVRAPDALESADATRNDDGRESLREGRPMRARRAQLRASDDLDGPAAREQSDADSTRVGTLNFERPSPAWLLPKVDAHRNQGADVTAAQAPAINVTIGRVEIRAVSSVGKSARGSDPRDSQKRMSLDEYLARRRTER